MFDPLDLYTPEEEKERQDVLIESHNEGAIEANDEDSDYIVDVLELPSCVYANWEVIMCVLVLLRPMSQVNFADDQELPEFEDLELLDKLVEWYRVKWPNMHLNTREKVLRNIPKVPTISSRDALLGYYTSILQYYDKNPTHGGAEPVLREVSLRIAENCGRTAQPAISRDFKLNNLEKVIRLHEPSLTADNLGWKTWGSSLVLADIVVDLIHTENLKINGNNIRTLELGAGTGLVGIAWAEKWRSSSYKNIKSDIYLTDLPEIVENLKKNVAINDLDSFVTADVLDWTDPSSFITKYSDERFDFILVADPIYSPQHPEWVVNMIIKFLKQDGVCHLQIPVRERYSLERALLWRLLDEKGLSIINERLDKGKDDWGDVEYIYKKIQWK